MGDKKKLLPALPTKGDAFTRICDYMTGKAVVLLAEEENILSRWMYADTLLRKNAATTDEIAAELEEKFTVSNHTALSDIRNAQKLFARARHINKKYVGHLHLERINRDIENARESLFFYDDKDEPGGKRRRTPDAKDLAALAKLHQAYTDTLKALPEDDEKTDKQPPTFIFNLFQGQSISPQNPLDEALKKADEMISGGDYIDYENVAGDEEEEE